MGYIPEASSQVSCREFEIALRMWRAGEKESQEKGGSLRQPISTHSTHNVSDTEHQHFFQVANTNGILAVYKVK